jgi:flagellin
MGFRVDTSSQTLSTTLYMRKTNQRISDSIKHLSSGLRITNSQDDPSNLSTANSLRAQASSLKQAAQNANDGIGIIKISDQAMEEQIKILELIKVKSIQSAQDTLTYSSRQALKNDIIKLSEELDNIATTTSYNGIKLLNGTFTNKEFHIGTYSQNTSKTTITSTVSNSIGHTRFETGTTISSQGRVDLRFYNTNGDKKVFIDPVYISHSAGTGISMLAEAINKNSDTIGGVRASWSLLITGNSNVKLGLIENLRINGKLIGTMDTSINDVNSELLGSINDVKAETGVEAYVDITGKINFRSLDGRGIVLSSTNNGLNDILDIDSDHEVSYGRLTLIKNDSNDVWISSVGFSGFQNENLVAQETLTLKQGLGSITSSQADAVGFFANEQDVPLYVGDKNLVESAISTLRGARMLVDIALSASKRLEAIRSSLASTQQEISSDVKNINKLAINLKESESYIRDIDFGKESVEFNKDKILLQMGSFILSQANYIDEQALKLLQ